MKLPSDVSLHDIESDRFVEAPNQELPPPVEKPDTPVSLPIPTINKPAVPVFVPEETLTQVEPPTPATPRKSTIIRMPNSKHPEIPFRSLTHSNIIKFDSQQPDEENVLD